MESLFKQVADLKSDKELSTLCEGNIIFDDIVKMFPDGVNPKLSILKYIAFAYDKESPYVLGKDRNEVKQNACRAAGLNTHHRESLEIIQNTQPQVNRAIDFFLVATQPVEWRTIVTGEDVLNNMLKAQREFRTLDESKLDALGYAKYIQALGESFLTSSEVMDEIKKLRLSMNNADKGIHEIGQSEVMTEKKPEDIFRERRLKQQGQTEEYYGEHDDE